MFLRIARARSAKQSGISFRLAYFAQCKVAVKQPVKIIKYFFENVVDKKKSVCYSE